MTRLTDSQRDLLDYIDFVVVGFEPFPDLQELFKRGFVTAEMHPFQGCFDPEVMITPQGIAVLRGLN